MRGWSGHTGKQLDDAHCAVKDRLSEDDVLSSKSLLAFMLKVSGKGCKQPKYKAHKIIVLQLKLFSA